MCGEVAKEELWEDAIVVARNILNGQGEKAIKVGTELPNFCKLAFAKTKRRI